MGKTGERLLSLTSLVLQFSDRAFADAFEAFHFDRRSEVNALRANQLGQFLSDRFDARFTFHQEDAVGRDCGFITAFGGFIRDRQRRLIFERRTGRREKKQY